MTADNIVALVRDAGGRMSNSALLAAIGSVSPQHTVEANQAQLYKMGKRGLLYFELSVDLLETFWIAPPKRTRV